ncbi:MAG: dihydrofolate reductase [Sporichthyaceae bacterium]
MIGLVWAQAANGVIGRDGALPWRLPEDLARFKRLTTGATVVMGRATWDSLPSQVRPLPGRRNVVLTRDLSWSAVGAVVARSLAEALGGADDVWVMGGAQVYREALPSADVLVVTELASPFEGDRTAPVIGPEWVRVESDPPVGFHLSASGLGYRVVTWRHHSPE